MSAPGYSLIAKQIHTVLPDYHAASKGSCKNCDEGEPCMKRCHPSTLVHHEIYCLPHTNSHCRMWT